MYDVPPGTPGGSHMAASYTSGGKLGFNRHFYFFDANFGEYKVNINDVPVFLREYMDEYKKKFAPVLSINFVEIKRGVYGPLEQPEPTFTPYQAP